MAVNVSDVPPGAVVPSAGRMIETVGACSFGSPDEVTAMSLTATVSVLRLPTVRSVSMVYLTLLSATCLDCF